MAEAGASAAPIRVRATLKDGVVDFHVLMPHPMETGLRSDAAGQVVPAHFITDVTVSVAGRLLLRATMSLAVAQDPLLGFRCRGVRRGEVVSVHWADNLGQSCAGEAVVA